MRKDQRAFVLSLALAGSVLASVATPVSAAPVSAHKPTPAVDYVKVVLNDALITSRAADPFYKFNTTTPQPNAFYKF